MSLYYKVQLNKNSFSPSSLHLSCKVVVTVERHAFRFLAAAGKSKEV